MLIRLATSEIKRRAIRVEGQAMSEDRLRLLAAKDMLDIVGAEAIPSAAINALQEGVNSPSIWQLAGMSGADNDEVRRVFQAGLRELGIDNPSLHEAVIIVAVETASRIVQGAISPDAGAEAISSLVSRFPLEHWPELDTFVYGASEWAERPQDHQIFAAGIVAAAHDLVAANQKP
jgi:hypothetical protein